MTTAVSLSIQAFDAEAFGRFELAGWEAKAAGWHQHFEAVSTQAVGPLLDAVGISTNDSGAKRRLLDVATGPGYAAAEAARRGGEAIGVDFATAQIELARANFPAVRFDIGDAEALPYETGAFDAVVINFGLQHFTNAEQALAEAYRVLRPGGQVAYTVWAEPPHSVGFHIIQEAIEAHGNPTADIPAGPPYYRFSNAEASKRTLKLAGFHAPRTTIVPQHWHVRKAEDIVTAVADGTVRAGALLRAQTPAVVDRIRDAVVEAAEPHRRGDGYVVPMPGVLAAATKVAAES